MSQYLTALTGAGTAIAVGMTLAARSWTRIEPVEVPTGRHRGRPDERLVPLADLMRPTQVLDEFEAYCPAEDRPTLQIRLRVDDSCLCTECRNRGLTEGGGR
jgi:hypothetical protein